MKNIAFFGVAAIAAAVILAPGAGHAQAADTTRACFNKGLYAQGAVIDYDSTSTGDGAPTTYRTKVTARAPETYKGVQAVPLETQTYDENGKRSELVTGYVRVAGDFLQTLGAVAKAGETTFDPASRQPIDLPVGETYRQRYKTTLTGRGGATQTIDRLAIWTFAGFEEIRLPVGRFRLCKITLRSTDTFAGFSIVSNQTMYLAAEGRYQGFTLRSRMSTRLPTGQPVVTTTDVTKFRTFAPK